MVSTPLDAPLPPLELEIMVEFQSEFHIGTGHSIPGVVDDRIVRDSKGRLLVPGTTLKGVIRDATETVARLLNIQRCDGTLEPGGRGRLCGINYTPAYGRTCYLCTLFGNRGHEAKLRFGAARYDPKLGEVLADNRLSQIVRDRLARPEWHNRIHRDLGRAQEDFLFSYELGTKTWEFSAPITEVSLIPPELRRRHLLLLLAGIHLVRELGGKRRAGKGECRLKPHLKMATDETVSELLDRLKELGA